MRWKKTTSEKACDGEQHGVGDFVAEVLRTYHGKFWLFVKITAPAVIISWIALIARRNEAREIARHLPRGYDLLAHRGEILEIWLVNFSAYLISWMVCSFSFAAISIALEESAAGFAPSPWHSLLNVREHLGTFLRLSLLLFVLVLVAEAVPIVLGIGVFWVLHQWHVHPSQFLILVVSYVAAGLALLVVSRFALAVPAVVLDDCTVKQAMFRSDELTQGKLLPLAALLAESLIGAYVAAMCPFWVEPFIRVMVPLPSWFPWVLTAASIIGVNMIEPTMFVGFALLYLKKSAVRSAPDKALLTGRLA
jgi:hypothetical protein